MVLSGVDFVSLSDGTKHPTGFYFSELAIPVMSVRKAGYNVVFTNPTGKEAVIDKNGDNPKFFSSKEEYQKAKEVFHMANFKNPRKLSSFNEKELKTFDGILVPGGHAPMEDLCKNADLGRILEHFHRESKPTALICHGPIALLCAKKNGKWIYDGYRVTIFSNDEEKTVQKNVLKGKTFSFFPSDAISQIGGKVSHANKSSTSHVVWDRELITGQNPQSEKRFTQLFLEALTIKRLKGKNVYAWPTKNISPYKIYDASVGKTDWHNDKYVTLYIGRRKKIIQKRNFFPT